MIESNLTSILLLGIQVEWQQVTIHLKGTLFPVPMGISLPYSFSKRIQAFRCRTVRDRLRNKMIEFHCLCVCVKRKHILSRKVWSQKVCIPFLNTHYIIERPCPICIVFSKLYSNYGLYEYDIQVFRRHSQSCQFRIEWRQVGIGA